METKYRISIHDFCKNYQVDEVFVSHFIEAKIIQIKKEGGRNLITEHHFLKLEKMVRLHQDLGINLEGLEAISHLLNRVESMNEELQYLRNRLQLYE
ncbi:chaperone modulator CbpM [Galbibacter orientalis]|uniref:chaperone modulator CbpM n=1 Tax=Galbibacter orientalis TaxID=453852 RepID=UPI0030033FEE